MSALAAAAAAGAVIGVLAFEWTPVVSAAASGTGVAVTAMVSWLIQRQRSSDETEKKASAERLSEADGLWARAESLLDRQDKKLAAQDEKIAEQDKKIAGLYANLAGLHADLVNERGKVTELEDGRLNDLQRIAVLESQVRTLGGEP